MRNFLLSKLTRPHLESFIRARASEARTLDIGCADSPYSRYFPNRVGFDAYKASTVDLIGDAHALPFDDASFEMILCTEVLEHLHTPEKAIAEMHRVLKPGGLLILSTRFIFPIHDAPGDYFRFTKYGLTHLFRDWEIRALEPEVTTGEVFGVLLQRIAFQCELRGGKVTKAVLLLISRMLSLRLLIRKEYGRRTAIGTFVDTNIMTSGYYLEARR